MLKSASTYKAFLGLSLAFFFGLTLGLTLNLVGSQTTENRSQAAVAGQLRNYYCTLSRNELNAQFLKQCNGVIGSQGFYGWEVVSDSHAYNGTQDGAAGNNVNKENTVKIGNSITLNRPEAQLPNPQTFVKDTTTCSAVQHDGDGNENGDVFVQYIVDANNYCFIYHNDHQGKTQRLNRCKLQNLNGGALTYWDNDQAPTHPDYQPLNRLKEMYDQKCGVPTPTAAIPYEDPTASMVTSCAATQTGAANLGYLMKVKDFDFKGSSFMKNEWWTCIDKLGNGANVYNNYFGGNAMWENNNTACYRIGEPNTYLGGSELWFYLGKKPSGSSVGSSNLLYYKDKNANYTVKTKSFTELATWSAVNGASNTPYRLKINLWSQNAFSDKTTSTYIAPIGNDGIRINPTACIAAPTNTPTPTPTTPVQACTYTQTVHTLNEGKYLANIINDKGDFTKYTHNLNLERVDVSKPIKMVADWGWTGKISGNKAQKGKVVLPGRNIDADEFWQRNETSSVSFSTVKPNNTLRALLSLTCTDVGEKTANVNQTPFVDGRKETFNGVARNLQDVYPDEPGEQKGDYFFCPQSANAGWPVAVTNPKTRADYQYSRTTLTAADYYNPATKLVKLQVKRQFLGSGARTDSAIQTTDNARLAGSHYTRVTVSFCQLP